MNPASAVLLDHAPPEVKQAWNQRIRWRLAAHQFQIAPLGKWRGWMLKAGRGAGKTRTGAQDAVEYCLDNPGYRYAVVAPTQGDVRATCFEGDSGIIAVLTRMGVEYDWQKSVLELHLSNGSLILGYSAEKPDRLRGPQFHRAWCDELAAWKDAHLGDALNTTFNNLNMGLRLGSDARMVITTTPKRVALVRELLARPDMVVTNGTTYDNLANLSPTFAEAILQYEGTAIGRQELLGELIEEVEGALWKLALIDRDRWRFEWGDTPKLRRVVVGVDPSGGAAEIGIVAAGLIVPPCPCGIRLDQPHYAILDDASLIGTPEVWGRAVVKCGRRWDADLIAGEVNYGGQMVESTIKAGGQDDRMPYEPVTATRGKEVRAEPISRIYEQGRVHHLGAFPSLEDELTTWTQGDKSPNRLDAMVWAMTKLSERAEGRGKAGRSTYAGRLPEGV